MNDENTTALITSKEKILKIPPLQFYLKLDFNNSYKLMPEKLINARAINPVINIVNPSPRKPSGTLE